MNWFRLWAPPAELLFWTATIRRVPEASSGSEIAASLPHHSDVLLQDYIVGLGGVGVTAASLESILDDVQQRSSSSAPIFVQEATL